MPRALVCSIAAIALGACPGYEGTGVRDAGRDERDVAVRVEDARVPDAASTDAESGDDAALRDDAWMAPTACPVSGIVDATYGLDTGAFPTDGHPDVAVHVPDGYDACAPAGVVVFFHGFRNCVANVIGASPTECTSGAGARSAFALSDQLDAAGVNAILVAVELRYDEATSDPGALAESGRLRALLDELYDEHLSPLLGRPTGIDDVDRVVLASHSGGYVALARCLTDGGVTVHEVELFDSLYGELTTYRGWLDTNLLAFDASASDPRRFALVFTDGGGTASQSRALGDDVEAWLAMRGNPASLLFDDTTATLEAPAFRTPIVIKRSALSHDGGVSYYFEHFLRGSDLPPRP